MPLIAAGPGVKGGRGSKVLVSTMDLAATFWDDGGVERPADMDSRTLRPSFAGGMDPAPSRLGLIGPGLMEP